MTPDPRRGHWAVTVERDGEPVVTIASTCLSGRDLSPEDEAAIRTAAQHLLSFVGTTHEQERQHAIVDAVLYALRCGCFFPVPEPKPGASVQQLTQWGALRHLHDVIAAYHQSEEPRP